MKTIIVSGSDEKLSYLLMGLLDSLGQWDKPLSDAIGVLDLGLSEITLSKIRNRVTEIKVPDWDFDINPELRIKQPYLRAKLSRPFLPKYFPGYDLYLWLDADTWVQEKYAVNWYFRGAADGKIAICPSADRSFIYSQQTLLWRKKHLFDYFGQDGLDLYKKVLFLNTRYGYYNDGAFCLRADAPHWTSWANHFEQALSANPNAVSDQAVLNYAIWKDELAVHPLPSLCNWACHLALPIYNEIINKLCEPHLPYSPIGLIHLTGPSKEFVIQTKGGKISLQFPKQT